MAKNSVDRAVCDNLKTEDCEFQTVTRLRDRTQYRSYIYELWRGSFFIVQSTQKWEENGSYQLLLSIVYLRVDIGYMSI